VATLVALHLSVPRWLRPGAHDAADGETRLHGALLAVLLMVLAWGLVRRRLVAYISGMIVAGSAALALGPGLPALLLIIVALLLAMRPAEFPAQPGLPRLRTALTAGLVVLVAGGVYDIALRWHDNLRVDLLSLLLVAAIAVLVIVLPSTPAPGPADDETWHRVRGLATHPAADTLAPFALRRDKTYVFSRDGRAAVGYRVIFGVAVVGGDPVGDPDSARDAVDEFVARCGREGWRPAVLGVSGALSHLWHHHGLRSIGIGDEVLLDIAEFSLSSRRMRNVRQAVARTYNSGVSTVVVREGDLEPRLRSELAEISAQWLRGSRERGFSMILDGLLTGVHPDCLLVIAHDRDGRVVGFQRYAVCGDSSALSLDTMRRDRNGPNGLNERMIVDLVEYCRARGIGLVSLNFAAFRTMIDAGSRRRGFERIGYRALHLLDPLIQVESLYLFNAKFRPRYRPRSVAFPSWLSLPSVLGAMLVLEFAGGSRRRVTTIPVEEGVPVFLADSGQLERPAR
jgi:lysyl-tRNA synthetase class 2